MLLVHVGKEEGIRTPAEWCGVVKAHGTGA